MKFTRKAAIAATMSLAAAAPLAIGGSAGAVADTTVTVVGDCTAELTACGDTFNGVTGPGWMFGRDANNRTAYSFASDEASTGGGSIYVAPITNTNNGNADKFVAEFYPQTGTSPLDTADFTSFSIDYKRPATDTTNVAQAYVAIYAFPAIPGINGFWSEKCVYTQIATVGDASANGTGWRTLALAEGVTPNAGVRQGTGADCGTNLTALDGDGYYVGLIAVNLGDTSGSDLGSAAWFDNAVITTTAGSTAYDFEPDTYTGGVGDGATGTVSFPGLDDLGSPSITLTGGEGGATVEVYETTNPVGTDATPFSVDGAIVEIDVTGNVGPVTICLDTDNPNARLFHFVDSAWVDVTDAGYPAAGEVCGTVDSTSPFAIGQVDYSLEGFLGNLKMDRPNVAKAGSAVPVQFRVTNDANGSGVTGLTADDISLEVGGADAGVALQEVGDGYYQFVVKSAKTWKGSTKTFEVTVDIDGVVIAGDLTTDVSFT